jgi:hypothetical protein
LPRGEELKQLAADPSHAVERARHVGLPTTVYLLAMALVEVREASETADGEDDDGAALVRILRVPLSASLPGVCGRIIGVATCLLSQ